jgi:exosome complex component RRP45
MQPREDKVWMFSRINELCQIVLHRVIAQVEAKMVKPTPERPFEGSISIHSEISPMASSDYEAGR